MGYSRRATERRDCYQGWQRGSGPWWGVAKSDRAVASPEGAGGVPSVPACPATMWPCLLLALALLGTVSASHPAPCQLQGLPAAEATQLHYVVVKKLRTYSGAQRYCRDVYRGQLVSVHSAARNQELQKLAQSHHTIVSPWIGAVTSRRQAGQLESYWEDSSPWNYANWAPTHPFGIVTTCTTLSVRGKVTHPPCRGLGGAGEGSTGCWGIGGTLGGHYGEGLQGTG
ncbi:uncharacterized protein [Taeniopygia guttata]|uniref:uncharacterized protein isoform X1 n=1 Tax=Taeniopygia guttata TaxID=59729 RepID=UPI003BB8F9B6